MADTANILRIYDDSLEKTIKRRDQSFSWNSWEYPDEDDEHNLIIQYIILAIAGVETFKPGEKDRVRAIELSMCNNEVVGYGTVPEYFDYVMEKIRWALTVKQSSGNLSVANILTAIEKPENITKWQNIKIAQDKKYSRSSIKQDYSRPPHHRR